MKILFLPNWTVKSLINNDETIQSPDKMVKGKVYWFFNHFPQNIEVDIIDKQDKSFLYKLESKYLKFYIIQTIKAFFCKKKYDVVISHGAQSGLFYSLLNQLRRKKQRPLHIIIDVGAMNGGRINKIETPIIKFALRSKPVIIYHSSCQKVLYETVYKNVVSYAEFIHFGVNIDEFRPLNLPVSNYILSFGYEKRDYPTLLKAWKATHHPGTKLCIIGDDSILETETIKVISKIDILELKQYIASSLFVIIPLPVFYYSYGQMSFLQSMAMGKPVIVTETPSSVDYLKDVTGALLVKPYDSFDLKYKIEYLLQNKEILAKMGDEARKYIASTLNEETMAKKIHNLIVKCTSKKLN